MNYNSYMDLSKGQILAYICSYLGWNIFELNDDQVKYVKRWHRYRKDRLARMAVAAYRG